MACLHVPDARPGKSAVSQHANLMTEQRHRLPPSAWMPGQQADRHLLAGGSDDIQLALVRLDMHLLREPQQAVGLTRHGRDDDSHLVALALRGQATTSDVPDALDCATEVPPNFCTMITSRSSYRRFARARSIPGGIRR